LDGQYQKSRRKQKTRLGMQNISLCQKRYALILILGTAA